MTIRSKAYGFLKCWMPHSIVNSLIPQIRQETGVLPSLELRVSEGIYNTNGDFLLYGRVIAQLLMEGNCDYVFEGRSEELKNKDIAEELRKLMTGLHESPLFIPKSQKPYKIIVYQENDQYQRLE